MSSRAYQDSIVDVQLILWVVRVACKPSASIVQEAEGMRQEASQTKMDSLVQQIDVHLETNRAKLREIEAFLGTSFRFYPLADRFGNHTAPANAIGPL